MDSANEALAQSATPTALRPPGVRLLVGRAFLVSALALASATSQASAEVSVKEVKEAGKAEVVVENSFVRLRLDLLHGARVTSFLHKATEREWVGSGQGLFADHVWQQTWPGELYNVPYEAKVDKLGPEEGSVTVWRVLEGVGQKDISGVRVERTLRLRDSSPAVEATIRLTNTGDGPRSVGYWSQHIFTLGGPTNNHYLRPSARGLSVGRKEYKDEGRLQATVGEEWVKDPVAGWSAAVNPVLGEAAVFLMDYNDLRWLYNCIAAWTTEWYYDLLRMAPGREWTTRIVLLPVTGYREVTHASEEVIADIDFRKQGKEPELFYTIGAGVRPVGKARLEAELLSLPNRRPVGRESKELGDLTFRPQQVESTLDLSKTRGDFLIRVHLTGEGLNQSFERCFERKRVADHLVADYPSVTYPVPRPQKKKALPRPANLALNLHEGVAVLELRGMFYPHWRLAQALGKLGEHRVQPAHFVTNVYGDRLDYFPAGYEEMLGYDLVVLEDIPVEAIGDEGLALLKDYVEAGGGLLVCGGWYSFAGGGYAGSVLEELLPVRGGSPPDMRWQPKGLPLRPGNSDRLLAAPATRLRSFVYWTQEVKAVKPGGTVALRAGDKPFLVGCTVGKGRTACLLGAPCGSPLPGQTGFWDDPAWPDLLAQVLRWVRSGQVEQETNNP